MTGGLGLATAAPASAAPSPTRVVTSQDVNLALLDNVEQLVVIVDGVQLIDIDVSNVNVVALNNIVIRALNNIDVRVQNIDVDVNIDDNVLIVIVDVL